METVRVMDVILDPRSSGAHAVYTYAAPPGQAVGDALIVPLGGRPALGFILDIYDACASQLGFPIESLRPPLSTVRGLGLPESVLQVARAVSKEYLCPLPVALSAAIPPGAKERLVSSWRLKSGQVEEKLSAVQIEVVRFLRESGGSVTESRTRKLPPATQRALKALRGKGVVEHSLDLAPFEERRGGEELLRLTADHERIEAFLTHEGRKKPAQALTLIRLQTTERSSFAPAEIKGMAGVTDATLKSLVESGLLERTSAEGNLAGQPPEPNRYQSLAIDSIVDAIKAERSQAYLLFGVTGSGKTEVYLRSAAEALRLGRQVLYIVPEIALAAQAIGKLRERFGSKVAVLHSELPNTERLRNWVRAKAGQVPVVLGARSALFAPLDNIGLIVMDEEHEASYKQESAPRYHAKKVAMELSHAHGCPVVLGSATPSLESMWEADRGELTLLSLPERAANARLPEVRVDDLAEGYREGKPALLCEDLRARIEATLAKKQQVILFLNRRAYSPFIICRDCGYQARCRYCAVSLSFHRRDRRLRCHHCGYGEAPPDHCPKCQGVRVGPFGVGTERVEETVAELFPSASVARLDRDIARKKGALEDIFARFRSGDIDILVGTQMVAKGLDFPNVTLVGVVAADLSLNIPDFRAGERTFQLLSQVSGRAGRGQAAGSVVIQTFNPLHPAVSCARDHDFVRFYEGALEERREARYPPFCRLVNVVFSGLSKSQVGETSAEAASRLSVLPGCEMLGPVDCALERLQSRWRRHILVKLLGDTSPEQVGTALAGIEGEDVHVLLDVDPYMLM